MIHLFYNHDAVYGFGYLMATDLSAISSGGVATSRNFASRITGEIPAGPTRLPYDYTVELHVTCEPDEKNPDDCPRQYATYREAAETVGRLDAEIQHLTEQLRSSTSEERTALKRALRELRSTRRPAAVDLLDSAHHAYQACRADAQRQATIEPSKDRPTATGERPRRSSDEALPVHTTVGIAKPL